ncbi:MAG: hypothetical protein ACI4CS_09770 [Candidatus Weimeria sp.]
MSDDYFDNGKNPFLDDDEDDGNDIRAGDDYEEDDDGYYDEDEDRYSHTAGKSFGGWFLSVILSLIPVFGVFYLIVKGVVKKDAGAESTWARAQLAAELILYMSLAVVFVLKPDVYKKAQTYVTASSSSDGSTAAAEDDENKDEAASRQFVVTFSTGAAIGIGFPEEYKKTDEQKDETSDTITYMSDSGKMFIAVCIPGAGSENDTAEDSIKERMPEGSTVSDFKTSKNEYFVVTTYKKTSGDIVSYECSCYGVNNKDYIVMTSDEPVSILSASYQ